MKRILSILILIGILVLPVTVLAGAAGIVTIINNVVDSFTLIAAAVVALMFVLAGFYFLTSGGNSSTLQKAKDTALWAIIGAVVLGAATAIQTMVTSW